MITARQLARFSCCFREPCRIHTSSHVYSCAGCFREGPFSPLGLPIGYNCIDFSLMSSWVGRVCSKTEKVATSCQKNPTQPRRVSRGRFYLFHQNQINGRVLKVVRSDKGRRVTRRAEKPTPGLLETLLLSGSVLSAWYVHNISLIYTLRTITHTITNCFLLLLHRPFLLFILGEVLHV